MADQLYLSYWLRGFTEQNMLRHFEKMVARFPFSRLAHAATLRVLAISFSEPPLLERALPLPVNAAEVVQLARERLQADVACQLEAWWDLWQFDSEWKLGPSPVALFCFGPEFESDEGESLQIDFGLDTWFLPQAEAPGSARMVQSNIRSLLHLVHELDDVLAIERRRLETESGENFAERLQAALQERQ